MSENPSQTKLPELEQYLSQPIPGMALLRYHSRQAFEALVQGLALDRSVYFVRYRPRAHDESAAPSQAVERCGELARLSSPVVPIIFLWPEPNATALLDLNAQAVFWKNMNVQREALGSLPAQIILTLDDTQTAACFHHAKDLVSWCSPKFELRAGVRVVMDLDHLKTTSEMTGDGSTTAKSEKTSDRDPTRTSSLTWDSLYPLLQKELQTGQPLPPRAIAQLLFPLMRHALDNGDVTLAALLLPAGERAAFPDERTRSVWLEMNGDLAVAQGDLAGALRHHTARKAIAERLAADDPANAGRQRDLSVSLEKMGDLSVAQGDLATALLYYTECKFIAERLAANNPANAAWQRDLFVSQVKLGDLAVAQGDLATALLYYTECKSIAERLAANNPANDASRRDLFVSQVKLGDLAVAQGDLPRAMLCYAECKTIAERLAANDPANAAWQRDLSVSLDKLGDVAVAQGDLAGALRCFTECKNIFERLAAKDLANALWQRDLSVSLNKLGDVAVAQGDLAGALLSLTESMTIRKRLATNDPANAAWQRDLSYICWLIADKIFLPEERWTEALELVEQSLRISERLSAADPTNVMWQDDARADRTLVEELRAKVGN